MAQDYARKHNLDLDEVLTFHDEGVSGFRGQNNDAGKLAEFREAVRVGLVPSGSILLVEQLDRLSRMVPRKAMRVLEDIVEAGVSVVTLNDGREYSPESLDKDPMDLLVSVLTFIRANEESETKSRRLKQSWQGKREKMGARPLTSKCPAWLRLDKDIGRFILIQDRAEIVSRIFSMTLNGMGQHRIAEALNREGVPTWGRAEWWQRSYIAKILTNPAVIGTITPHIVEHEGGQQRKRALEPVFGYYPRAIPDSVWEDVQALQSANIAASKGAPISNILAGLATCPRCGKTMTRVQKGAKSNPSFVCVAAKVRAGCEYRSVRCETIERRLVHVLPSMILEREGIELADTLEDQIADLQIIAHGLADQVENLLDNLSVESSPALRDRLRQKEAALGAIRVELAELEDRRDVAAGPVVGARIERAVAALRPPEDGELDRSEANRALRSLFNRAIINWPEGTIDLEWKAGGTCRVHYTSVLLKPLEEASPRGASVYTKGNE
jgi:DNA invertase Pin-like site-specific DNA recombinase